MRETRQKFEYKSGLIRFFMHSLKRQFGLLVNYNNYTSFVLKEMTLAKDGLQYSDLSAICRIYANDRKH